MHKATTVVAVAVMVSAAACGGGDPQEQSTADTSAELVLLSVADPGPDPFTDSTAAAPVAGLPSPANSPTPRQRPPAKPSGYRSAEGSADGLYGGSRGVDSCDAQKQIRFLKGNKGAERAFAEAVGLGPSLVPAYLRSLTSVVLRKDTRVTGHGLVDGRDKSFPAVLQSGTAVLIDDQGVPRVRCACGNPLTSATPLKGAARHTGRAWSGYVPAHAVVVTPASRPLTKILVVDEAKDIWIERPVDKKSGRNSKDKIIPSPPTRLEVRDTGTGTVELTWKAARGHVEVAGYRIFQRGKAKPIREVTPDSRGARISNVKPGTEYSFTVRAVDEAGNTSAASDEVDVLTNFAQTAQPEQSDQPDPSQQQSPPGQSDQPDPNQQQSPPGQSDQPDPNQQQSPPGQPDQPDPNQQQSPPEQPQSNQ